MSAREGPNVELVRVRLPPAIARALPSDAAEAFLRGIPRRLLEDDYLADTSAAWFEGIPGRRLVRFGVSGWDAMCLDVQTGEVVGIPAGCASREELVNLPPLERMRPYFVNSSLSLFAATVSAVNEGWPADASSGDRDASDRAANHLVALIAGIDPPAVEADRYWSTLVDDVEMGDYYTP